MGLFSLAIAGRAQIAYLLFPLLAAFSLGVCLLSLQRFALPLRISIAVFGHKCSLWLRNSGNEI
jgi:hypothetical protein